MVLLVEGGKAWAPKSLRSLPPGGLHEGDSSKQKPWHPSRPCWGMFARLE